MYSRKILVVFLAFSLIIIGLYIFQDRKIASPKNVNHQYQLAEGWPALPDQFKMGNPTGVGVDKQGDLFVFHRAGRTWPLLGKMPEKKIAEKTVLQINGKTGQLMNSWGADLFIMPHGLTVDNFNQIWVTDVGTHQIHKFTHEGKLLLTIGELKHPGNDKNHFNRPTDIAVLPSGSFYVSDGYGNSRITKFSAAGKYLFEWGKKGDQPGEFNIPHGISLNKQNELIVADRENNRIQFFDSSGNYLRQITHKKLGNLFAVAADTTTGNLLAIDDISFLKLHHRGSDIISYDAVGKLLGRFGRSGGYAASTGWYHDIAIDKNGNIYVADMLHNRVQKFVLKK
jgi:peptidylamidoglycolate lyase